MVEDSVAITNLLYRYAECMDNGDFAGAAALFGTARIRIGEGDEGFLDPAGILANWEATVMRYADGTPRTKHVTTNAIVEIADDCATATSRSYYCVLQQLEDFPLQPIISGRYHDQFAKVDGTWEWVERDYTMVDLIGDLSRHLTFELPHR